MSSILNATTTTGLAISPDNSGSLQLATNNGTTAVTIDTSQNVGIGTSTITSGAGWSPRLVLAGADTALIVKGNGGQESSFGTSGGLYLDCLGNSTATNNNIVFRNTNVNSSFLALERMRIDTSGNVGIGTNSPTDTAGFGRALDLNGSAGAALYTRTNGSATSWTAFGNYGVDGYINNRGAGTIQFYNNNAERMRITSAGQLLVGTTSWTGGGSNDSGIGIKTTSTSAGQFAFYVDNPSSSNILNIRCDGSTYNTTGVWGTISDQRLKENIVDATPKLDNLLQLKVRNFNFTNDENKTKQIGFVAQEIEQVFPSLVSEDAEGTKAVKTTVLLPMLVKAIQEQQAQIEELKAELDATKAEVQALKGVA